MLDENSVGRYVSRHASASDGFVTEIEDLLAQTAEDGTPLTTIEMDRDQLIHIENYVEASKELVAWLYQQYTALKGTQTP